MPYYSDHPWQCNRCEIAGCSPGLCAGKQVTVVTSAARLLADKPPKIGAHAASWIQQKGGKVSKS